MIKNNSRITSLHRDAFPGLLLSNRRPGVNMSKIPQGEWRAIAARYSQGESISSIARHYGCTAPAIYYILKRSNQRVADAGKLTAGREQMSASTVGDAAGAGERRLAEKPAMPAIAQPSGTGGQENGQSQFAARMEPAQSGRGPLSAAPQQQVGKRHSAGRAAAFTAELDPELQAYAEAAIEAFRASFDEALVQRSTTTRERLRQAASDLMRAAARTTIVLDRLDASAKPTHIRAADWPRHPSAQLHA